MIAHEGTSVDHQLLAWNDTGNRHAAAHAVREGTVRGVSEVVLD